MCSVSKFWYLTLMRSDWRFRQTAGRQAAADTESTVGDPRWETPTNTTDRLDCAVGSGARVGQQYSEGEGARAPVANEGRGPLKPPCDKTFETLRACREQYRRPKEFENTNQPHEVRKAAI